MESSRSIDTRVIVVEDDPTLLMFWGRLLKDIGIKNFKLYSNPVEASVLLQAEGCDLLISDIIMPDMNGYRLARIAYWTNPSCRIILTTAYNTDLSRFDLKGCNFHLLHKPYSDIAALKRFISHFLDSEISFDDIEEESSSENEDYPQVREWKL